MEQQESTGIGWFIAGLGLGALVGVLFAPKAGKDLREGLISGARESKEYVANRSKQARDQINSVVDRSRDQINTVVDRGREQMNEYAERGKEIADKGRERWSGMVDRVAATTQGEGEHSRRDEEESYRGSRAEGR